MKKNNNKNKSNKKNIIIIIVEIIIIIIALAFIISNFVNLEDKNLDKEENETKYLSGRYYIKDYCQNLENCQAEIGQIKMDNKTYDLSLEIKNDDYILNANDKEIYNVSITDIDYIEIIENFYIIVHQVHSNGTYQTDIYNSKLNYFFHIISRKVKSKDTDMWIENNHDLYYYDYSCSNTDKRYAAKFYVDLSQDVNAPILQIETYEDDYMPNCNA